MNIMENYSFHQIMPGLRAREESFGSWLTPKTRWFDGIAEFHSQLAHQRVQNQWRYGIELVIEHSWRHCFAEGDMEQEVCRTTVFEGWAITGAQRDGSAGVSWARYGAAKAPNHRDL